MISRERYFWLKEISLQGKIDPETNKTQLLDSKTISLMKNKDLQDIRDYHQYINPNNTSKRLTEEEKQQIAAWEKEIK